MCSRKQIFGFPKPVINEQLIYQNLPKESVYKLDQCAHGVQLELSLLQHSQVDVSSGQPDLSNLCFFAVNKTSLGLINVTTSGRYWSNMKLLMSSGRLKASIRVGTTASTLIFGGFQISSVASLKNIRQQDVKCY